MSALPPHVHARTVGESNTLRYAATARGAGVLLPDGSLIPHFWTTTPTLRAYALKQILNEGDVAVLHTALWVHTGRVTHQFSSALSIARRDGHRRAHVQRLRLHDSDLCTISGLSLTSPARTAVDLLAARGDDCVGDVLALRRSGCSLEDMSICAAQIRGVRGTGFARHTLQQLAQALPAAA